MSHQPPIDPTWQSFATLQQAINALPDPIFIKDRQHRWIALNNAFCRLAGHPAAALLGASDPDFWPPDQAAIFWAMDDVVFSTEQPQINEEDLDVTPVI